MKWRELADELELEKRRFIDEHGGSMDCGSHSGERAMITYQTLSSIHRVANNLADKEDRLYCRGKYFKRDLT